MFSTLFLKGEEWKYKLNLTEISPNHVVLDWYATQPGTYNFYAFRKGKTNNYFTTVCGIESGGYDASASVEVHPDDFPESTCRVNTESCKLKRGKIKIQTILSNLNYGEFTFNTVFTPYNSGGTPLSFYPIDSILTDIHKLNIGREVIDSVDIRSFRYFKIRIPKNTNYKMLSIRLESLNNDCDLYVHHRKLPSFSSFEYSSATTGIDEVQIPITSQIYYISIYGYKESQYLLQANVHTYHADTKISVLLEDENFSGNQDKYQTLYDKLLRVLSTLLHVSVDVIELIG